MVLFADETALSTQRLTAELAVLFPCESFISAIQGHALALGTNTDGTYPPI